jgi:hypothetical protein
VGGAVFVAELAKLTKTGLSRQAKLRRGRGNELCSNELSCYSALLFNHDSTRIAFAIAFVQRILFDRQSFAAAFGELDGGGGLPGFSGFGFLLWQCFDIGSSRKCGILLDFARSVLQMGSSRFAGFVLMLKINPAFLLFDFIHFYYSATKFV